MARFALCLALVATLALAAFAEEHVLTLTGETLSDAVKNNDKLVVEFYAPWCGHCKKLTPEYEKAAGVLKDEGIVLAKVDATEDQNKEIASKFGVRGFPTLKVFRGDEANPEAYEGPRDADGIVAYARKLFGPATALLADADAVAAAQSSELAVVGVFPAGEDSAEFKAFKAVAEALRDDAEFKHVTDAALVPAADGKAAVIVYKNFDAPETKFDGAFEEAALKAFIGKATTPRLISLDRTNKNKKALSKVFADDLPKVLGVMPLDHADLSAFQEKLIAVQDAHSDIHVLFVDPKENEGALNFFDVTTADLPALLVHEPSKNGKYSEPKIALDRIESWVSDYKAGKIEKRIKSEEIPESNDGPVTVVVAKQFDEIVFSGKDVLIEFYAPWCGHCKKLEPIYNELGEAFKDNGNVVIAKMDATANDVASERFNVKGFPTIAFVSGADQKVHDYSGDRSLESLKKFIAEKATAGPEETDADAADADDKKDEL